jgi:uncharacterized protein with HEPN domain
MKKDDNTRLKNMIDTAHKVIKFSEGHSRKDLDTDQILASALIREIGVIGEAAARVSTDKREQLTEIPWKSIVGMRNRLIHDYDEIDLDLLWETVTKDVPELIKKIEKNVNL